MSAQRILVVDDQPDAAAALAMLLRAKGHDVAEAHDGRSAVELFVRFQPRLVFLDLRMPVMSGFDVLAELSSTRALGDATVIALTGLGEPEEVQATLAAGFHGHLVKPPPISVLDEVLKRAEEKKPVVGATPVVSL